MTVVPRIPPAVKRTVASVPPPITVIVYICPTEGCGNYYASPTFRPDRTDIHKMQYSRSQNDGSMNPAHPRVECPDCRRLRGLQVDRVGYVVAEVISLEEALKNTQENLRHLDIRN